MTRIDTSAQRAAFRAAVRSRNSHVGLLLTAIANGWDSAEEGHPGEAECARWSPVVKAALEYVETS